LTQPNRNALRTLEPNQLDGLQFPERGDAPQVSAENRIFENAIRWERTNAAGCRFYFG
jgi:hypothetical protein